MTATTSTTSTGLQAQDLCFGYQGRAVIDSVSLELQPGTLTALVGPNGAGKSTLLHLLQGRLKASSGAVHCLTSIALMPQRAAIDWSFPITVLEMVKLGRPFRQRMRGTEDVDQLLAMGFPRGDAEAALVQGNGTFQSALDILLGV